MRGPPPAQVQHAVIDHAGGDAAPDPVGDAKLALDDQMPDVMRQRRARPAALQPEDHSVVPLDHGIRDLLVGRSRKRYTHMPTMRTQRARGLMVFTRAPARPALV